MAKRNDLTAEYVRSILSYNPETGVLTWLERPREQFATLNACGIWNARFAGKVSGARIQRGYLHIRIDGRRYLAHRLAWLIMNGSWPEDEIDHRDGNPSNNRFNKLREATRAENGQNRCTHSNNTSGFKGVCWRQKEKKWRARIRVNGECRQLGLFESKDDAVTAYETAARKFFGEFARTK